LIERRIISVGTLNASVVHPREVFEPAVALRAAGLIVCHNHPSGELAPSESDCAITRRLAEAGKIMGIDLLDHIIVISGDFLSLKEKNLM
jgi:DNA repair protein RadC